VWTLWKIQLPANSRMWLSSLMRFQHLSRLVPKTFRSWAGALLLFWCIKKILFSDALSFMVQWSWSPLQSWIASFLLDTWWYFYYCSDSLRWQLPRSGCQSSLLRVPAPCSISIQVRFWLWWSIWLVLSKWTMNSPLKGVLQNLKPSPKNCSHLRWLESGNL